MVEISPGIEVMSGKLGGKPYLVGTRISVFMILEWLEAGESIETIVKSFEGITLKQVSQAITFTKLVVDGEVKYEIPA